MKSIKPGITPNKLRRIHDYYIDGHILGDEIAATVIRVMEQFPPEGTVWEQWAEVMCFHSPGYFFFINCPNGVDGTL